MKRIFGLVLLAAMISFGSTQAMAQGGKKQQQTDENQAQGISPGGSDSCGLGWQVTDKKTLSGTTTRESTNYTIPSTFGMTSGTMGCEKHEFAKNEVQAVTYASNNIDSLSVEMAQGHGEYLDGFAVAMGCGKGAGASLGNVTRAHYNEILNDKTTGEQMYKNLRSVIRKNSSGSLACKNIG